MALHLIEYLGHRYVLHSTRNWLKVLRKMHLRHHTLSSPEEYELSKKNPVHTILMGPFAMTMSIVWIGIPVSLSVGLVLFRVDATFATISAFVLYVAIYEGIHFLVHIRERKNWLYRSLIAPLRSHHEKHHENLGKNGAYGVTSPVFDFIFNASARKR